MEFLDDYKFDFSDVIPQKTTKSEKITLSKNLNFFFKLKLKNEISGIVIVGIDKNSMKNAYCVFEMLFNDNEKSEIDIDKSQIRIFAQDDVIETYLTGIDDEIYQEISENINSYIAETLDYLLSNLKNTTPPEIMKKINIEANKIKNNSIFKNNFED